jgi:phage baseplate assembly protein W
MFLERKFLPAPGALPDAIAAVVQNLERILTTERGVGHVLPDFGLSQSGQWSQQGVIVHYSAKLRENLARYERRFELVDIDAERDDDGRLVLVVEGRIAGGAVTLHVDPQRRRVRVARVG